MHYIKNAVTISENFVIMLKFVANAKLITRKSRF